MAPRPSGAPTRPAAPSATGDAGVHNGVRRTGFPLDPVVTVDFGVIQRETSARTQESANDPAEGPVRTCIGCRRRELAVDLLRVVAVDDATGRNAVTVDVARRLPGRGAWLHPDPRCLDHAVRRRAFGRALRITGSPDITAVIERFASTETLDAPGQENR